MSRRQRNRADMPVRGPRRRDYSETSGPVQEVDDDAPYRVRFRNLQATDGRASWLRVTAIAVINLSLEALFLVWLLQPAHRPPVDGPRWLIVGNIVVIGAIALMEAMRLVNVVSLSVSTIVPRDPIPVRPQSGERVAFVTTIVPGKEPLEMVERTLAAARRIHYDGVLDMWLLDEGDDSAVKQMCARLGVHHFTRKGKPEFNRPKGRFKAKTKHGNYNSWLFTHGQKYTVMMSVDPDHSPLSNYAERVLGYFRDPDIAYVVGPQCYANCDNFVTTAAESQLFLFHSVIQRAANRYGVPMLVGTNNAIRISAIVANGGISDSVTEDMATGLKLHTSRNPATGRRWRSVYTPDMLAIGEGPSSWSDYFSQQLRWSRGTFELLRGEFWRRTVRLTPFRLIHYLLIVCFEQRLEIYTPPYLFRGPRPTLTDGPVSLSRGQAADFATPDADRIASARLIRPSAVTHATDVEQRSVALDLVRGNGSITVTLPREATLLPPGEYLLFVTDTTGVPSIARWVHVT